VSQQTKCPTCDSPAPELHPAVQCEGEVQICRDSFHAEITPSNTRERWLATEAQMRREAKHAD
jgi:hypothetical protein